MSILYVFSISQHALIQIYISPALIRRKSLIFAFLVHFLHTHWEFPVLLLDLLNRKLRRIKMLLIFTNKFHVIFLLYRPHTWGYAALRRFNLDSKACLTTLESNGVPFELMSVKSHRILQLNQGAKFRLMIFQMVIAFAILPDDGVAARHANVICNANIWLLASAYFQEVFVFSVYTVEYFGCFLTTYSA